VLLILLLISGDLRLFQALVNAEDNSLQWFLEDEGIENIAWPFSQASPKNAPWFPSCGSMKLATASSWRAGASESNWARSFV
jgi:hypothetical protein